MVRRPRSSNLAPPWLRERLVTCFLQEPQGGEAGVRIALLVPSPASGSPSWGTSLCLSFRVDKGKRQRASTRGCL